MMFYPDDILFSQPQTQHEEQSSMHSDAYSCVADFAGVLKNQAEKLKAFQNRLPGVVDVNYGLEQSVKQYDRDMEASNHNELKRCHAHLKFIHNVLYDQVLMGMITDPIYVYNRGGNAADHKFAIYQYDKNYNEERRNGMINPRRLHEKSTSHDGHYIKLPEFKCHAEQFYRDILGYAKKIESEDEHTTDGLIKKWVSDNEIKNIVHPPATVEYTPNPVFTPSAPPPAVIAPPTLTPSVSMEETEKEISRRRMGYLFLFIFGATIGFAVSVLTVDAAGLSKNTFDNEGNGNREPTSIGWAYMMSLTFGLGAFFSAMYAVSGSKQTMRERVSDMMDAVTPSLATLSAWTSGWHMMIPSEMHFSSLGSDSSQRNPII